MGSVVGNESEALVVAATCNNIFLGNLFTLIPFQEMYLKGIIRLISYSWEIVIKRFYQESDDLIG